MSDDSPTLTENTKAPLRIIVGICVAVLGAYAYFAEQFATFQEEFITLRYEQQAIHANVGRLESLIREQATTYIPRDAFENWVEQLHLANPDLTVPDASR